MPNLKNFYKKVSTLANSQISKCVNKTFTKN